MNIFIRDDKIKSRQGFAGRLNELRLCGQAVEIGVWRGDFSHPFLQKWKGQHLHLVDPWAILEDYDDIRNTDFDSTAFEYVKARFSSDQTGRYTIHRMLSEQAVKEVPDNLSFVYIDGNHNYRYVNYDLMAWWDKLQPGGILAGHDLFSIKHPGVTSAVAKFALGNNLHCFIVDGDYDEKGVMFNELSYYFIKPAW